MKSLYSVIFFVCLTSLGYSQTSVQFTFSNGSSGGLFPADQSFTLDNANGENLTAGVKSVQGDGAVVQFGIVDVTQGFESFTAISGLDANGNATNGYDTTVGDGRQNDPAANVDGYINASISLDSVNFNGNSRFGIRFFDSTEFGDIATIAYNTFYHPEWTISGSSPNTYIASSVGTSSGFEYEFDLKFDDGIRTIPEPSTGALLAVGLMAAVAYRRRRRA